MGQGLLPAGFSQQQAPQPQVSTVYTNQAQFAPASGGCTGYQPAYQPGYQPGYQPMPVMQNQTEGGGPYVQGMDMRGSLK